MCEVVNAAFRIVGLAVTPGEQVPDRSGEILVLPVVDLQPPPRGVTFAFDTPLQREDDTL